MTQRIERDEIKVLTQKTRRKPLRLGLVCGVLPVLISILSLSGAVGEPSGRTSVSVAQQPAATTPADKLAEAKRLLEEGQQLSEQKTEAALKQALEKYQQALPLFRAGDDKLGEGKTLANIGLAYSDLGDQQQAIDYYNQALPLFQAIGDKQLEAVTHLLIGQAYFRLDDPQQALNYYNRALPLRRTADDKAGQVEVLYFIGQAYLKLKQPEKALVAYNQVLEIQQVEKDLAGQALTFTLIGETYRMLEQPEKALAAYDRASVAYNQVLENQRRVKDLPGQDKTLSLMSEVYSLMGKVYEDLKQPEKALAAYNQLLEIVRAENDLEGQAFALDSMASVYRDLKEPEKALAIYNQLLEIQQAKNDLKKQSIILSSIALVYKDLNQPEKALAAYNQQIEVYNQILEAQEAENDLNGQASTLNSIADIYRENLKQPQKVLTAYNQLLAVYNQILEVQRTENDLNGQAFTLSFIADIYRKNLNLKQPQKALTAYNQLLAVYNQILEAQRLENDLDGQVRTLNSIADIYRENLNQPQKALTAYNQVLEIQRTENDLNGQAFTLRLIASAYDDLKQPQKVVATRNQQLTVYNQLLESQRKQNDLDGQAETLDSIARIYMYDLNQPQKALTAYNQLLAVQRAQKDLNEQASTLRLIASAYDDLKQPQKVVATRNQQLAVYNQILESQRKQKDLDGQASTLDSIGYTLLYLHQFQKALDTFNQAIELLRTTARHLAGKDLASNRSQQVSILDHISLTYYNMGDGQKDLTNTIQAAKLRLADEDPKTAAETLNDMARYYDKLGNRQEAFDALSRALQLQQQIGDSAGKARTLRSIANLYFSSGESQKALDLYSQALAIQQQEADLEGQAKTFADIADIYSRLGDDKFAIETYSQAQQLVRQNISKLANSPPALSENSRKQQEWDLESTHAQEASPLLGIGEFYEATGEYKKAEDTYKQALALLRSFRFSSDVVEIPAYWEIPALLNLVRVYQKLGDYPQARASARSMMEIVPEESFKGIQTKGIALALMGEVYLAEGNYQKALEFSQQALSPLRTDPLPGGVGEAKVFNDMGQAYTALKQYPKATESYNLALIQARKWSDRRGEAQTLYLMAKTERDRGNLKAARTQIEAALTAVEDLRTKVADPQLRTSYFASVQEYYEFYIDLLMQLHRQQPSKGYNALALQANERARARSLLELLAEAQADIKQGIDPQLLEQERDLQFKLAALEKRQVELYSQGEPTKAQKDGIKREQDELLAQYRILQAQIRATSPHYANLKYPQPLTLPQIQQQVLDDETVLLEYSLGEKRSYLWVVTKTSINSYELPKRADIEAAAENFYKLLKDPGYTFESSRGGIEVVSSDAVPDSASRLSQMILAPAAQQLKTKRLLVVSDGAIQQIPFAALPLPNQRQNTPLLSQYEIVHLPSSTTLGVLRQEQKPKNPATKTVAVLADPVFGTDDERFGGEQAGDRPSDFSDILELRLLDRAAREGSFTFARLPHTEEEAQQILRLVPESASLSAFGFAASRTRATSPDLSQYEIVHFATHGILDSVNPELSGVVLSLVDENGEPQNGFLRLHDIFNLNLPVELIVLSACETGLGQKVRGEGLVGLTRGFMYAGSPRVLVSLWRVNDESTAQLMTKFYSEMLEKGLRPAAALRAAQLAMLEQQKWSAPYYWAAFTLQGEWR